ncbi:sulfhydryl oxidase [Thraustotheca clavata]|uniref:Sulfhydryl oxidase n=1 Tax=Thraustotheca clavata TaxID=74557 RepID=A0A1V9ZQF7_9STRA|nr:sulfhydryl oxidase [Thraustotheca clavata]
MGSQARQRRVEQRLYAETRAKTWLQVLSDETMTWNSQGAKHNIILSKSILEQRQLIVAKAVTRIPTRLPNIIKELFQSVESTKAFQKWTKLIFPETYLDGAIVENLYDNYEVPFNQRATTKWYATSSPKSKLLKANDYFVVESIGVETNVHGHLTACTLYQESIAEMDGQDIGRRSSYERDHIDALLVRFERLSTMNSSEQVLCSILFQKIPSSSIEFPFGKHPAIGMSYRLAIGFRKAFEVATPLPSPLNHCITCRRSFHLFKRKHLCRFCNSCLCSSCFQTHMCPDPSAIPMENDDEAKLLTWMRRMAAESSNSSVFTEEQSRVIENGLLTSITSPMSSESISDTPIMGLFSQEKEQLTDYGALSSDLVASTPTPFDSVVFESNVAVKSTSIPEEPCTNEILVDGSIVSCASAWALDTDIEVAVNSVLEDLHAIIGHAHFMVVSYSSNISPQDIQVLLEKYVPGVPYIGGTIARGICDEQTWVTKHKNSPEGLVAIWGIHDPFGSYIVGHTKYDQSTAMRQVSFAIEKSLKDLEDSPDFCMVFASPLYIDDALEGAKSALKKCPVVGGCATNANSKTWSQISSASHFTQLGMSYCLVAPSVKTILSWFSGYEPIDERLCTGLVTDIQQKTLYEIGKRPAADVYYEWLAIASDRTSNDLTKASIPKLGNLHPIGHIIKQNDKTTVCSTPVMLDISFDSNALTLSHPIEKGETIALMGISASSLTNSVAKWGQHVQSLTSNVNGCLLFMPTSIQVLLGSQAMSAMINEYKKWSKEASFLALSSFGQIGPAPQSSGSLYDPLMFSSIPMALRSATCLDCCMKSVLAVLAVPIAAFWGGNREPLFTDSFSIETLTKDNFDKTVLNDEKSIWLVDFYAPWCPHCRHFAPHYEAVADHYAECNDLRFGVVDCTIYTDICTRYEIMAYPALRMFHLENRPVEMPFMPRAKTFESVVTWIETAFNEKNRSTNVALPDFKAFELADSPKNIRGANKGVDKKVAAVDARVDRLRDAAHSLVFAFETSFFMGTDYLNGERYTAARTWLRLLAALFPLEANQKQLAELLYRFESQSSWTSDEWRLLIAMWKSDTLGNTYPKDLFTRPNYAVCETYTCGVWFLFHELTVADLPEKFAPLDVALGIRTFVEHFFGCELCRMHFLKANPVDRLEGLMEKSDKGKDALVLWMYHMHNIVNVNVEHEVWPSKTDCKLCYKTSTASANRTDVVENAMLKFMKKAYFFPSTDADIDRPFLANEVAMGGNGTAIKGSTTWDLYKPSSPIEIAPFLIIGIMFFIVYKRKPTHDIAKES